MKKLIIILGTVGSGKDTQAELLSEKVGLPTLSIGQAIRDEIKNNKKLSRSVKTKVANGKLLPTSIVLEIFNKYLDNIDTTKGLILNGLPRNPGQIKRFNEIIKLRGFTTPKLFNIVISDETALRRIASRGTRQGRHDLSPQAQARRLEWSKSKTTKVVNYFRKHAKVYDIDGEPSIELVFKQILNAYKNS